MWVKTKQNGLVTRLSINRPRTNSLNQSLLLEINQQLDILEQDSQINVVIIHSAVSFGFSAGLDLGGLYQDNSQKETAQNILNAVRLVFDASQRILHSEKIYIAEITGPVIGSALSLILACDLRVAAFNTWLWSPDPQYGGMLADGAIELTRELIGNSRALMLHLTNERINAKKADEWGLFYQLTTLEKLAETTDSLAKRIASLSPYSLRATKKLLNQKIYNAEPQILLQDLLHNEEAFRYLEPYLTRK